MIAQARQLTVIADSSKLGRRALFQVFPLSRINRLVVDRKPTGNSGKPCNRRGWKSTKPPAHPAGLTPLARSPGDRPGLCRWLPVD